MMTKSDLEMIHELLSDRVWGSDDNLVDASGMVCLKFKLTRLAENNEALHAAKQDGLYLFVFKSIMIIHNYYSTSMKNNSSFNLAEISASKQYATIHKSS